ncbi:sortilin-related receptor-like [Physella acuta]|uniref:sortilin-related receptor-like n=1 Tax=Physella acuta TaxID=109671 RepID=UPI0027DD91C9|nr:sortilin-related receptor-like [Physella acuta]
MCVWKSWVCDGTPDCPQGDDERNCQNVTRCAPSEFQCVTDGGCIPFSKRCNNKVDCMDSSDELQCGTVASDCSIFNDHKEGCCNTPSCGVYYTATNPPYGRCTSVINASTYRQSNRCDGVIAAPYECLPGQVKCNNTKMTCISWVQVCDNQKDCVGNSMDEDNCYDCQSLGRQHVYLTPTNTSMHFVSLGANLISYAEKVPDLPKANLTWKNFSRISGSDDTILGLKPATPYVFVFFQTTSKRLCPVDTSEMSTLDGLPSEPKSVTTALRLENYPVTYIVDVQWKKPDAANGKIISYVVYYQQVDSKGVSAGEVLSKTITGQYQQLKNVDYQTSVVEQIEKGKTYDFWVTAVTSAGEGTPSKKVTIATDSIPQFDLKVTVANVSATGFTVKWVTDPNAVGYKVTVISLKQSSPIFPAGEIKDVEKELSKTETSLLVADLCPQSDFKVLVQALYANKVKGLAWKAFSTTTGTQPLVSIAKVEKTGPTSAMVSFNVTQGSAKKFHIYYTHDNHASPLNLTSLESSYEIKGLYACENYFVWVRPVSPFCPSSGVSSFITEEDDKAPPKDLEYELTHESYQFNVTLKWTASCYKQSREIGYIITVQNGDNPSTEIAVQQTSLTKIKHTLSVKDNQIYTFSVRTLVPGSQNSPVLKVKIPSLAGPVNFVAEHVGGLQVVLRWTWDFISDPDFREFLVFSSQGETTMKNHTSKQEILLSLPTDGTYFFKVHAMSKEGETIAMSQELQFSFENVDAPTNDKVISLSQTNFVAILVPVAVVVVGLSAGLVFFIVRHRRLQRSFLAFANSHYNIQSGTTTFSDDLDGDEPMIQGFSDDEPLVIA